ncbi:MAG: plasmid pRiA4b ORF-3 family protein [Treponema sp.]|jgi:hypothetical protein|nr:plasmid pRiA4b ORF-3 family protein [Treponema sp.]
MTVTQEDAFYDFLDGASEPFNLDDVISFIRMMDPKQAGRLRVELSSLLNSRKLAFQVDSRRWVSRRGCFESIPFVINPSKLELLNGILIPGHRCIPFANPALLPHEYSFFWKGQPIPFTTTEGPPDEFYPYYSLFGEEYAPQYVAKDNPENEAAFNSDLYEDPPEVSIKTLDMRNVYREISFVPGDHLVVRCRDWKEGSFDLEKVAKDMWSRADIYAWIEAAEGGFEDAFEFLGPGSSTEEQLAYAYWYGGKRMWDIPACSLEGFIYEETDRIETVPYGIETRFWYAGKEIPDISYISGSQLPPDQTVVENILLRRQIPVSEYVIQSYIRDALFRREEDCSSILERVVPPVIRLEERESKLLNAYLADTYEEFKPHYSFFADQAMGPIRQRVGELHTAVIDLYARLKKSGVEPSALPTHTYIVLSQIQNHAAAVLEDLDANETLPQDELEAMDSSLDSMIDTYDEIKELIEEAMTTNRRNNLSVVNPSKGGKFNPWRMIQAGIGGTNVWRRITAPEHFRLADLHRIIQSAFNWTGRLNYRFSIDKPVRGITNTGALEKMLMIGELCSEGINELAYEYGASWTVKVIILPRYDGGDNETLRCVAGESAAPPELMEGPLRFRRDISALERGPDKERQAARQELGPDFKPDYFDIDDCNRALDLAFPVQEAARGAGASTGSKIRRIEDQ